MRQKRLSGRATSPSQSSRTRLSSSKQKAVMCEVTRLEGESEARSSSRRQVLVALGSVSASALSLAAHPPASMAKPVQLELKNLTSRLCDNPVAAGTPGSSSFKAKCYQISGTIVNTTKDTIQNADVYGRVFDSANDPVLTSGRVGAVQSVPPGESEFRLEITVAATQLPPLQLKKFKAQGFVGTVNLSGNPYEMDYEVGEFPGGTKLDI